MIPARGRGGIAVRVQEVAEGRLGLMGPPHTHTRAHTHTPPLRPQSPASVLLIGWAEQPESPPSLVILSHQVKDLGTPRGRFRTLVFLLILEAPISITHAESVSAGSNPIMFVFFAAFYCYLLLA